MKNNLDFVYKAAKLFIRRVKKGTSGYSEEPYAGICAYAFCTDSVLVESGNNACHAGLQFGGRVEEKLGGKVEYVVDAIYPSEVEKNLRRSYIKFIMSCKAYKDVFVQEDVDLCLKRGYVLANTDVPSNLLASGLFSLRMGNERPTMINSWGILVDMGIDEAIAYVLCHTTRFNKDKMILTCPEGHHIGLNIKVMEKEHVYNFLDGVASDPNPLYKEYNNYYPVEGVFGRNTEDKSKSIYRLIGNFFEVKHNGVVVKDERPYLFYREPKQIVKDYMSYVYNDKLKGFILELANLIEERKI